eukprot:102421-Pleurochrysis_carterae.AAC.2
MVGRGRRCRRVSTAQGETRSRDRWSEPGVSRSLPPHKRRKRAATRDVGYAVRRSTAQSVA